MKHTLSILVIMMLMMTAFTVSVDFADGKNGNNKDKDKEKRNVQAQVTDEIMEIELKQETDDQEDKIEITFDTNKARLELKYEIETNDTEEEQKLSVTFHHVIEYNDTNANGKYEEGEPIVSAWNITDELKKKDELPSNGSVQWQPLGSSDVSVGETNGKKISGTARFGPNNSAEFGLDFSVFGDLTPMENLTLQPTEMKIDIMIRDYPFMHNDTQLALLLTTKAEHEFKHENQNMGDHENGTASSATVGDRAFTLGFSWLTYASVDDTNKTIQSTILKQETEESDDSGDNESKMEFKQKLAFSYGRGNNVVHDPVVGVSFSVVDNAGDDDDDDDSPGFGIVVVVVAICLVAFKRRR